MIHFLLWCFLQVRAFFGDDRPFHRTDLQTNSTVNAGCKVNPVPVSSLDIFARSGVNAGDGARINAIGNAFTGIGENRMGHGNFLR